MTCKFQVTLLSIFVPKYAFSQIRGLGKKIAGIKFQQKEEKEEHPTQKTVKTCWFLLKIVRRV